MKKLTIIIADDVRDIQALIEACLESFHHNLAFASTGREAAKLASRVPFDLLITDVLMPDGDGLDLIRETKRLQPSARILVMSGGGKYLGPVECMKMATSMGAHAALTKPFNRAQLLAAINLALAPKTLEPASPA